MNYSLILVSVFAAALPVPGVMLVLFFVLQAGLSIADFHAAKNIFEYTIYSIHLLIATLIGHPLWMMLRYAYGYEASSSFVLMVPYVTAAGCIASIGWSVGVFFINRKKIFGHYFKY